MTRIRYTPDSTGNNLVSKPIFAGTEFVVVNISPKDNMFMITSYDTGHVIARGEATSLVRVKKLTKEKLKALGVNFDDEVRRREKKET